MLRVGRLLSAPRGPFALVMRVGEPQVVATAREVRVAFSRAPVSGHRAEPTPPLQLTPLASKLYLSISALQTPAATASPGATTAAATTNVPAATTTATSCAANAAAITPDPLACSSVLKKRRRKMSRHKHKKWLKKMKYKIARAKKQSS